MWLAVRRGQEISLAPCNIFTPCLQVLILLYMLICSYSILDVVCLIMLSLISIFFFFL